MPKIKCDKCGYEWETGSELLNLTCPSCLQKTPNTSIKLKKDGTRKAGQ